MGEPLQGIFICGRPPGDMGLHYIIVCPSCPALVVPCVFSCKCFLVGFGLLHRWLFCMVVISVCSWEEMSLKSFYPSIFQSYLYQCGFNFHFPNENSEHISVCLFVMYISSVSVCLNLLLSFHWVVFLILNFERFLCILNASCLSGISLANMFSQSVLHQISLTKYPQCSPNCWLLNVFKGR